VTLLTIVTGACDRLNLPVPTTVMTNNTETIRVLRGYAQEEGKELSRRAPWQKLTKEHTFTTIASADQGTSSVPSDLGWIKPDTVFNRTRRRKVVGPLDDQQWQQIQASLTTMVDPGFRIRGGTMLITPTPPAGETVAYEYVSDQWCESSGGTDQSAWAGDTDVALLDEELFTLGLIWRFRKAKGLSYDEDFLTYEKAINERMLKDGVRPRLTSDATRMDRVPYPPRVPDTLVF
jgi:hypothetical protein